MTRYYELTVSLEGVRPQIWRRFLLAADATFADLHQAIQDVCGWWNYHLYEFSDGDGQPLAGIPDEDGDHQVPDAATTPLAGHFDRQDRCSYVYDFGDDWQHTVVRDRVLNLDGDTHRRLLDGARAFPREDCGGILG